MMTTEKGFETALAELQQALDRLEAGNLPLEQSLELYEQGVRLWRTCQAQLNSAESRIEDLLRSDREIESAAAVESAGAVEKDYETSLGELEQIVEQLETDDLPLEKLVELAARGATLWRACQGRLDQAERKVELLLKDGDGTLRTVAFDEADE